MTIVIELTQDEITIVDDIDSDLLAFKWYCNFRPSPYAQRSIGGRKNKKTIQLHRIILSRKLGRELTEIEQVDHINGDSLDNRRDNLRLASNAENQHNKSKYANNISGYKGVSWHKRNKRWYARIGLNGKDFHLGYFNTPEEAYAAYCEAAENMHGEFSRF